jgi:hypothetical protein
MQIQDVKHKRINEAVEKIACLGCDAVSTKAAWKKNNSVCPKCKDSSRGVAESLKEGYTVLPPMDMERYTELPGLEGPFRTRSGKVIYYDPKEGMYYDRDSDMYISYDEWRQMDDDPKFAESKHKSRNGVADHQRDPGPAIRNFLDDKEDGDKKPLKKSTITKGHSIAKAVAEDTVKSDIFNKGDNVIALKGPHKGVEHEIIHDFGNGTYNVKPLISNPKRIRYAGGAAQARATDLKAAGQTDVVREKHKR